jgi:hypothetical protein
VQVIKPEMKAFLAELKKKAVLGIVGGSDYPKMEEQMGGAGCKSTPSPSLPPFSLLNDCIIISHSIHS